MTQTITVEGMSCGHCEQTVEDALASVPGVESAPADRGTESATIEGGAALEDLLTAVDDAGYDASV